MKNNTIREILNTLTAGVEASVDEDKVDINLQLKEIDEAQAQIEQEMEAVYEKGRKAGVAENQLETINRLRKINGEPPLTIEQVQAELQKGNK